MPGGGESTLPGACARDSSEVKDRIHREHSLRAFSAVLIEAGSAAAAAECASRAVRVGGRVAGVVVGETGDRPVRGGQLALEACLRPQLQGIADPVRVAQVEFGEAALEAGALAGGVLEVVAAPGPDVVRVVLVVQVVHDRPLVRRAIDAAPCCCTERRRVRRCCILGRGTSPRAWPRPADSRRSAYGFATCTRPRYPCANAR